MGMGQHSEIECVSGDFKATVGVGLFDGKRYRAVVCFEDNRPIGIRALDTFVFEAAGAVTIGVWDKEHIDTLRDLYSKISEALLEAYTDVAGEQLDEKDSI